MDIKDKLINPIVTVISPLSKIDPIWFEVLTFTEEKKLGLYKLNLIVYKEKNSTYKAAYSIYDLTDIKRPTVFCKKTLDLVWSK